MKTISTPFTFNSDSGAVSTTSVTKKIVEQQIMDILTTSFNERVMNSKYGANARSLLFEEQDPLVFSEFSMDAMIILNESLSIGKIQDLSVTPLDNDFYGSPEESTIRISVRYVVPPYDVSVLTFNLNNDSINFYRGAING